MSLSDIWCRFQTFGVAFRHLVSLSDIWCLFQTFGVAFRHLVSLSDIWCHFQTFGVSFRHLVTSSTWRQPGGVGRWCGGGASSARATASVTESRETPTPSSLSTDSQGTRSICTELTRSVRSGVIVVLVGVTSGWVV